MKQLYVVRWEVEVIVLAESEQDAYSVGAEAFHDIVGDSMTDVPDDASPMTHFPGDWDSGALPYGEDVEGERTIGDLIDAGAAPAYSALKARMDAAKAKVSP